MSGRLIGCITYSKWNAHLVVPFEFLGGKDILEVQKADLEKQVERRKTLEAKVAASGFIPRELVRGEVGWFYK